MRICAQVVRVKTLVDSAVRVELDLGEMGIPYLAILAAAQQAGESVTLEVGSGPSNETRRTVRNSGRDGNG